MSGDLTNAPRRAMIGNMGQQRQRIRSIFHQLYTPLKLKYSQDKWRCFYCGQEASTIDHQPPLDAIESMVTMARSFECVTVPCCASCNSTLSNSPTYTLSERMDLLKEKLRAKYAKQIRLAGQWTHGEIAELGDSLRAMVMASVELGNDAEMRILYPGHAIIPTDEYWNGGNAPTCRLCGGPILDDDHECTV